MLLWSCTIRKPVICAIRPGDGNTCWFTKPPFLVLVAVYCLLSCCFHFTFPAMFFLFHGGRRSKMGFCTGQGIWKACLVSPSWIFLINMCPCEWWIMSSSAMSHGGFQSSSSKMTFEAFIAIYLPFAAVVDGPSSENCILRIIPWVWCIHSGPHALHRLLAICNCSSATEPYFGALNSPTFCNTHSKNSGCERCDGTHCYPPPNSTYVYCPFCIVWWDSKTDMDWWHGLNYPS